MLFYNPIHDNHIAETARNMVALADQKNVPIKTIFNKIELVAEPGTTVDKIVEDYKTKCTENAEARRNSPEGRRDVERNRIRTEHAQETIRIAMAELELLDFTNLLDVINWFEKIRDITEWNKASIPAKSIVATFRANGFEPGVNCGAAHQKEHRENVARYIIGQALDNLESLGIIIKVFHRHAEEWREKFGHNVK